MHPEIISNKPGRCLKCGMKLTEKDSIKTIIKYPEEPITWKSYTPLIVVISMILISAIFISAKDFQGGMFSFQKSIYYFMIGFFIVFSSFKLIDLKGFAQGYSTYDILAKKFFYYGYIYPFIELFFGLMMILFPQNKAIFFLEFIIMTFSGIGVLIKLLRHEKFQCTCLGTFLKVPLTKVTLVEDFGMALLALVMLFFK